MQLNYIYQGDCIEVIQKDIEENSIQLIFADPPYNLSGSDLKLIGNKTGGDFYKINEEWDKINNYEEWTKKWIKECKRVLKKNGSIFICATYHNIGECMMGLKSNDFKINNIITWHKTNAMPNITKRTFTHSTEFVIWAVKGKNWIFNYEVLKELNPETTKDGNKKAMRDVWQLPLVQGKERIKDKNNRAAHPTQKPEELLKRIILGCSNEGDIILDPFCGSGTTCVVAKKYNRKYIGIELNGKYYKIIKERLKN